jgi:hypothetical protein
VNEFCSIALGARARRAFDLSLLIRLGKPQVCDEARIGALVEIQENASHTSVPAGVPVADSVIIGHSRLFINDAYLRSTSLRGQLHRHGRRVMIDQEFRCPLNFCPVQKTPCPGPK